MIEETTLEVTTMDTTFVDNVTNYMSMNIALLVFLIVLVAMLLFFVMLRR